MISNTASQFVKLMFVTAIIHPRRPSSISDNVHSNTEKKITENLTLPKLQKNKHLKLEITAEKVSGMATLDTLLELVFNITTTAEISQDKS